MKKMFSILMMMGISIGLATSAFAQTRSPRINQRERREQNRIAEGIESGRLNPSEAARLEREQARIRHNEAVDKADGHFTRQERTQIERQLNHANRDIYRLDHNRRHR